LPTTTLFDFCFVLPARAAKQKAALAEKLKDISKGKNFGSAPYPNRYSR
jgi:hypothetical protein